MEARYPRALMLTPTLRLLLGQLRSDVPQQFMDTRCVRVFVICDDGFFSLNFSPRPPFHLAIC